MALKAAHVRDADTEERIRREARALAAVRHPHCVQIHDLVPADGDPGLAGLDGMVIVMEYVRGESLGELVRTRGTVDDVAAARVWSSIAGALDAAHARGVLHRDVKPANIVVDADGQAHLIDFGIARQTGDATLTAAGFVLGTPDFLAPEVAAGGPATPESDAWQLAATIGYALCGTRRAASTRTRCPGCGRRRWAGRRHTCRSGRRTWRCCGRRWTPTRRGALAARGAVALPLVGFAARRRGRRRRRAVRRPTRGRPGRPGGGAGGWSPVVPRPPHRGGRRGTAARAGPRVLAGRVDAARAVALAGMASVHVLPV